MSTTDEKKRLDAAFPEKPQTLQQSINTATKDLHDSVNRLAVQRFTLGLSDYRLYREGIKSFYYIYVAFERTWAKLLANPATVQPHVYECLQAIAIPQLSRTNAIASDLIYLYGPDDFDVSAPPDKKVRRECVEYIEKRLQEKPHLVLAFAHQYYMALFAGGKMLLRQMLAPKDFFPLRRPAGTYAEAQAFSTNMFNFPVDQGQEDELRTRFKVAMEHVEVNLSEEEKTEIIQESRTIYQMNERLIRELDEICGSLAIPPAQLDHELHGGFAIRNLLLLLLAASMSLLCLRHMFV